MRRLDAQAMQGGLTPEVLMENAGRALAEGTLKFRHREVLVVCGGGNNGGDGLVAARWLIKSSRRVKIVLWRTPDQFKGECSSHWRALKSCGPQYQLWSPDRRIIDHREPVVDAFLGIGIRPPVTEEALALIRWMNGRKGPKVAADVPSGLDADRGIPLPEAVRARLTVTMGQPKKGLLLPVARPHVGALWVGDLGYLLKK
jgi:hydroxyethylthiazole kinase-like uncharacterized protein yjeF